MRRVDSWPQPARRKARQSWAATAIFCVALIAYLPSLVAQEVGSGGEIISSIEVVGAQRIEPETVFTFVHISPGDPYDPEAVNDSLKRLFESGLFEDVWMRRNGSRLFIEVIENPIINVVAFEGNRRIKDEDLEAEVQLRPRVVYTERKVESDVTRILELYRRSGRFAATVEPQIIELPENRVDLVFEINEGPVTGVQSIDFIGNTAFSDRTLRGVVSTKESAFYRFLSSADRYDPDRVAFDEQLLRDFYRNSGYADFQVSASVVELTQDEENFIITFSVIEGPRYRYGTVEIISEITDLSVESIMGAVELDAGDYYSAEKIENSVQGIVQLAIAQNFPFTDVRVAEEKDPETAIINITLEIFDGPRAYVERINIIGNVRTHDSVIRREFDIAEGDPYNLAQIRRANRAVSNLGYFESVDIRTRPGSRPDRAIIDVEVEEQSTGSIELAAGFSSRIGPLAQISFSETNLLGRGQNLRVGLTVAAGESEVDLSFTEPYFLGRDVSAGFDVFRRITDLGSESSFATDSAGAAIRFGYNLTERWRHTLSYQLQRTDLGDINPGASLLVISSAGVTLQSVVRNEFFFNALNRRFNPTDGHFFSYAIDVAGLGGNVSFVRNTASAGYFVPFFDNNFVLGLDGEVGYIRGLGRTVRITDNFFVGGDNLRGFDDSGIGPRDLATSDAIGGKLMATGTIELRFPNFLPESLGIGTSLFSDFGLLTETDQALATLVDTGNPRASVGLGISWQSPVGPVRIDLAEAILEEGFDVTESFRISVGTSF